MYYFGPYVKLTNNLLLLSGATKLENILQQVKAVSQAVLPLGLYISADPIVLEVSLAEGVLFGAFWQSLRVKWMQTSRMSEPSPIIHRYMLSF